MINNSIVVQNERLQRQHFFVLALIFLISISSLFMVYIFFPEIDPYV
jgi:hypothetical protein